MTARRGSTGNGFVVVVLAFVCGIRFSAATLASESGLTDDEEIAAFEAAGFSRQANQWRACEDPGTPSYSPGVVQELRDLDGDGFPEAVITESGTFCYGHTATGFRIVSRRPDGRWTLIVSQIGVPLFLSERGEGGWPDIEVGGPGFCFPVIRWNGQRYTLDRYQYAGEPCQPD